MKRSLRNGREGSESETEEEEIKTKMEAKAILQNTTVSVTNNLDSKKKPKRTLKYYGKIKRSQSPKIVPKVARVPKTKALQRAKSQN